MLEGFCQNLLFLSTNRLFACSLICALRPVAVLRRCCSARLAVDDGGLSVCCAYKRNARLNRRRAFCVLGQLLGVGTRRGVLVIRWDSDEVQHSGIAHERFFYVANQLQARCLNGIRVIERLIQVKALFSGFDLGNLRLRLAKSLGYVRLPKTALFAQPSKHVADLLVRLNIHAPKDMC